MYQAFSWLVIRKLAHISSLFCSDLERIWLMTATKECMCIVLVFLNFVQWSFWRYGTRTNCPIVLETCAGALSGLLSWCTSFFHAVSCSVVWFVGLTWTCYLPVVIFVADVYLATLSLRRLLVFRCFMISLLDILCLVDRSFFSWEIVYASDSNTGYCPILVSEC